MRCHPRSSCLATRATTPTGSARRSRPGVSRPASHRGPTAQSRSNMTAFSIASGTRSRTCSVGSRTGGASTPATIDAHIHSCLLSASLQNAAGIYVDAEGYYYPINDVKNGFGGCVDWSAPMFTRDLERGITGYDVYLLQKAFVLEVGF